MMFRRRPAVRRWSRNAAIAYALLSATGLVALLSATLPATTARFTSDRPATANIAAARIFRGERVTPAFAVTDVSSGIAVDGSSATGFDDSRHLLTSAWPAAFSATRYLDIELNAPLPAAVTVSNGTLSLRLASDLGSGSMCVYAEIRRASNDALLSTAGSSASPLGCTSGANSMSLVISVAPAVASSDVANDLRLRLFARDSATGAMRLNEATVSGDTPYSTFKLYPVLTRDVDGSSIVVIPWGLAP